MVTTDTSGTGLGITLLQKTKAQHNLTESIHQQKPESSQEELFDRGVGTVRSSMENREISF